MRKPSNDNLLQKATYLKTQLSLVRNVHGAPFSPRLKPEIAKALGERLTERIIEVANAEDVTDDAFLAEVAEVRFGLMSKQSRGPGYHLLHLIPEEPIPETEVWCEVMCFNHLTFSITGTCFDFHKMLAQLQAIVDRLEKPLNYVYNERYGYVSAQLTLMGTGLRIRSWMHLGALAHYNHQHELANAGELRGVYVEMPNSELPPPGNIFILFNRFSMGATAEAIVTQYQTFLQEVIQQEGLALKRILADEPYLFLDQLQRAKSAITGSLLVSEQEALDLLSDVRLGLVAGIIKLRKKMPVEELLKSFWMDVFRAPFFYAMLGHELERVTELPPGVREVEEWRDGALRATALQDLADFSITRKFINRAFKQ